VPVPQHLAYVRLVRRHDGAACRHVVEDLERRRIGHDLRLQRDVERRHCRRHLRVLHDAGEAHARRQAQFGRQRLQPRPCRTVADDGERQRRRIGGHVADQRVHAVPVPHEPHEAQRHRPRLPRRRDREAVQHDSVGHDMQPVPRNACGGDHVRQRLRHRQHPGRRPPHPAFQQVRQALQAQRAMLRALLRQGRVDL